MMRSGNPTLRSDTFRFPGGAGNDALQYQSPENVMTLQGAIQKSAILLFITIVAAAYAWIKLPHTPWTFYGSMGGGFVLCLVISFKKTLAPSLAWLYALLEGVFLGLMTRNFETMYDGIAAQAIGLTLFVFLALLIAYQSKLIKPTENFKLGVAAATGGIFIFYIVGFVASLLGFPQLWGMHSAANSSWLSIGISLFVVVIASMNLVIDFDFIEEGAESGAPKYMEWYAAFGLLVTLIWLYFEILRLVAKLQSRD